MSKKAIVFLTEGAEEIEFSTTVDILRRAQVEVTVVGVEIDDSYATLSRGIKVVPDVKLEEFHIDESIYDAAVVPGGAGSAKTLSAHKGVHQILMDFYEKSKWVAFICAGTLVAKAAGIPGHHTVTSFPGVKDQLQDVYKYSEERVVVSENVITSRGPGTSFLFALTIAEKLVGPESVNTVKEGLLTLNQL
ncbi:class I glutamine amidotransferase-like protein [Sporodiniella umbellata]|nr:class I glutamine amidotransferase-like protein [Sporodiniella umbellata]